MFFINNNVFPFMRNDWYYSERRFKERRFDRMKENNLSGRLFKIQTKDLFALNNIYLIQKKYLWVK